MSDSEDELDRTAEVASSSSSSSESDGDDYKDIRDTDIKLAQMRRAAKEKGTIQYKHIISPIHSHNVYCQFLQVQIDYEINLKD